jgi:hypothetical protein
VQRKREYKSIYRIVRIVLQDKQTISYAAIEMQSSFWTQLQSTEILSRIVSLWATVCIRIDSCILIGRSARLRTMRDYEIGGIDTQVPDGEASLTAYVDLSLRSHYTVTIDKPLWILLARQRLDSIDI